MDISSLQGKVIVITGALGDAGREAIALFLQKGACIAASDIKPIDTYPEWEDLLQKYGRNRMLYMEADFTNEDQVSHVFEGIREHFGRLDGSYHNVYINPGLSITEMSAKDWNRSLEGTLTSAFLVCKYAAQLMIASGGGSMVNTSSILGTVPRYNNASYGAGKAGMEQLTRYAAVEFAPYGIRANAIVPGDFKGKQLLKTMTAEYFEAVKKTTLIGRNGTPNEINEVAAFLLSDAASYVTGSVYPVTGGLWL